MRRGKSGGAVPRRFLRSWGNVPHAALFAHALFLLPAECFLLLCLRRPHFFQQRKKWGKERRQKPMVFGFPFARLQLRYKKVPQRIACTPIPAAAPTYRIAVCCSTNIKWRPLGPHQHLPPLAASGRFDNRYGGRPAQPPAWYVGAAAIRGSQVIRCTTICSDLGFAWCMAAGFSAPQARRKS